MVHHALARAQKKARREGRIIVWIDEAGFYLLAGVVRSYAPRGQTPVLRVPLTRDHLSVISAITRTGRLRVQLQECAFNGGSVTRFLGSLRSQVGERLLIIWDGAPIHHDQILADFLAGAGKQMRVEWLPGYAPDLNPVEGVWDYLKNVELANVACHNQAELRNQLARAVTRLQRKPHLIRGFIKHYGY